MMNNPPELYTLKETDMRFLTDIMLQITKSHHHTKKP